MLESLRASSEQQWIDQVHKYHPTAKRSSKLASNGSYTMYVQAVGVVSFFDPHTGKYQIKDVKGNLVEKSKLNESQLGSILSATGARVTETENGVIVSASVAQASKVVEAHSKLTDSGYPHGYDLNIEDSGQYVFTFPKWDGDVRTSGISNPGLDAYIVKESLSNGIPNITTRDFESWDSTAKKMGFNVIKSGDKFVAKDKFGNFRGEFSDNKGSLFTESSSSYYLVDFDNNIVGGPFNSSESADQAQYEMGLTDVHVDYGVNSNGKLVESNEVYLGTDGNFTTNIEDAKLIDSEDEAERQCKDNNASTIKETPHGYVVVI